MRRFSVLLVVSFLIIGVASPASAITNHNLTWGFEVGDRFHYTVSGSTYERFLDYYVEINAVSDLPEDIYGYSQIMTNTLQYTIYFENGTEYLDQSSMWMALPVGNWTFVQELMDAYLGDYTWINTATEWGLQYSLPFNSGNVIYTTKFSKADGALNLHRFVMDPVEGETTSSLIRRVTQSSITSILTWAISIGSLGVIVVMTVQIWRKKKEQQ